MGEPASMSFLQREIGRARSSEVVIRCVDGRGVPVAGAQVSLRQVASAFRVGGRISEETRAALPLLARLGSEVLLTPSVSSGLLAYCAALGLQVTFVLPAPRAEEAFASWREHCFEDEIERAF